MWKPLPEHRVLASNEITPPYLRALLRRLRTHADITWAEYEALTALVDAASPPAITDSLIAADRSADQLIEALIALAVEGRPDSVIEPIVRRVIEQVRELAERDLAGLPC